MNSLQNCYKTNDSFSHRVERLFDLEFYCLDSLTDLFQIGRDMDCWVTGRHAAKLIGGRGLFDRSSHLM